ncbi:MAG: trigger factor [Chloroflexi bacterium RBG_13_51_36]|nr:MAG: trigger factor [Chloroflexi bacterium RBG_13_51_36]
MKVSTESLENCRIALNIEAEAGELDKSLDEAYRHLVNEVSVPGFRKGKAPRAILEQHVGKRYLLEEALEHLIPQLYGQAVESQKLEPIARPEIKISQTEPVIFKAVVSLKPEIKLGDYHDLKLEATPPAEISEKEVTAALNEFQERQGAWVPVDRAAQLGDLVAIDIQASVDGKPWLNHKNILYEMNKDSRSPVPGFASQLQDTERNKEKSFSLTVPVDYPIEEMRGKEGTFQVTVAEVKEKQLPELNDELAKGAGYDNLEDMKRKVNDDLKAKAGARNRLELSQKALDGLVEISEVKYPPVLEDEEINELLRNQAQRLGFRELNDYLKKTNRKEEEIRQELRPIAKRRLTESLVLGKLAEEEKIEISSSEVDNRIGEIANDSEDKEKAREFFSLPQIRQSIEQSLRTQKTMDRLLQIAVGKSENMTKGE